MNYFPPAPAPIHSEMFLTSVSSLTRTLWETNSLGIKTIRMEVQYGRDWIGLWVPKIG